jgi:quinol monooxygenase YgiN
MNQVQEMLRLSSADKSDDAVLRLAGLLHVMAEQPGLLGAEVLRNIREPEMLLVLHAWRDIEDWQAFQKSVWKVDFTASRPAGLYDMVPCGMNWRSLQADGAREGALLRREVVRDAALPLRGGDGVEGCQTYVYADEDLAQYSGCTLRLSRLAGPQPAETGPDAEVLADELFESLITVRSPDVSVFYPPASSLPR